MNVKMNTKTTGQRCPATTFASSVALILAMCCTALSSCNAFTAHAPMAVPIHHTTAHVTRSKRTVPLSASFLNTNAKRSASLSAPAGQYVPLRAAASQLRLRMSSPNHENENEIVQSGGTTVVVDEDSDSEKDTYQKAIFRTIFWVAAAGVFGAGLWLGVDPKTGEEFFAGYLVEQSLSVDNLFVFLLLFDFFKVPLNCQDRVLNWGIYGAIVMRALMIGIGAAALYEFRAILLVFAGILIFSSAKVLFGKEEEEEDMKENYIVQFSKKLIDSTDEFDGDRFFTLVEGVKKATPLFICMIAVEISDVVFAIDSIPAVFGITENALVVFASNMFAIMGLRSLYTILSKAAKDLKYLEPAVAYVLGFIGSKMIAEYFGYCVPTAVALVVVAGLLGGGIGLSLLEKNKEAIKNTL